MSDPRIEAKLRGEKFYLPTKPCKHGNIAPRYVSNSRCTCEAHARRTSETRSREVSYNKRVRELREAAPINQASPLHGYFVGLYAPKKRAKK